MVISSKTGLLLVISAVMLLELLAVFNNGGYFIGAMTLCAAGLWVLVARLAFVNRFIDPRGLSFTAGLALAVLGFFWIWTGISIIWSITPGLTWVEFNRTGAFLAAFLIGVLAGGDSGARRLAAYLFLFVATAASLYGVGAKALPEVIDNLDNLARVAVPVGYINAQGLMGALAYPFAVCLASVRSENRLLRILPVMCAPVLLLNLFFTISRGATLALVLGMTAYFIFSPLRLRSFAAVALTLAPVVPIALWSSGQPALMDEQVSRALREAAASPLRLYVLAALLFVGAGMVLAMLMARRVRFGPRLTRVAGASLLAVLATGLIVGSGFYISSKPSFGGWVRQTYTDVTSSRPEPGAARLFNVGAKRRWQIWREAEVNWEANPVIGSGAQSFPLVHLNLREEGMPFVKQPHGLPFRMLTELGLVGLITGMTFISATLFMAALLLFRIGDRWQRGLAASFLTMTLIYLTHTLFDWDWNIMAVTMPYFLFTGIMVGWYESLRPSQSKSGAGEAIKSGDSFQEAPAEEAASGPEHGHPYSQS